MHHVAEMDNLLDGEGGASDDDLDQELGGVGFSRAQAGVTYPGDENGLPRNWGALGDLNYPPPRYACACADVDLTVCVPPPGCCGYRKVGNMFVVAEGENDYGEPKIRCAIGACWPMMLITYALTLSITGTVYYMTFSSVPWYLEVAAVVLLGVNVGALAMTGCGDPGIVARYAKPLGPDWAWSEKAQCFYRARPIPHAGVAQEPFRVQFCHESKILVRDEDHFCPWTGTTIAGGNIHTFYIFVSTIFMLLGMVVVLGWAAGKT